MKKIFNRKILILLLGIFLFSCDGSKQNNSIDENNKEAVELEKLKLQKQKQADSLKAEIEMLKSRRDSIRKVTGNGSDTIK